MSKYYVKMRIHPKPRSYEFIFDSEISLNDNFKKVVKYLKLKKRKYVFVDDIRGILLDPNSLMNDGMILYLSIY